MSIDPTKSGAATPPSGPRLDQTGESHSARQTGQPRSTAPGSTRDGQAAPSDRVQLSADAQAAGRAEGTTSASGLTTERLQEVLKRLTSGYYDTPQVQDVVARRISEEQSGR